MVKFIVSKVTEQHVSFSNAVMVCPDLPAPQDGMVEVRERTVGGEAVYRCNPGLVLRGNTTRTCVEDGMWTGEQPVCEGKI